MDRAEASDAEAIIHWQPPFDEEIVCFLLEWEQLTVESYAHGIKSFNGYTGSLELIRLRDAHAKLVAMLIRRLSDLGSFPPLGSFIGSVRHGSEVSEPETVLKALQAREQETMKEWTSLLECDGITSESRDLIQEHLLPRIEEFQATLCRLGSALSPVDLLGVGTMSAVHISF